MIERDSVVITHTEGDDKEVPMPIFVHQISGLMNYPSTTTSSAQSVDFELFTGGAERVLFSTTMIA